MPIAWIAQSVERTTLNRVVVGSIPTLGVRIPFGWVGDLGSCEVEKGLRSGTSLVSYNVVEKWNFGEK